MTSTDFLKAYTQESTGPGTGLPVVSLRFGDADDLTCPFVTQHGCRVYPARPASCRTYPLARGVSRDRATGQLTEHWALIREPHCLGFQSGQVQSVVEWVDDQQIATYNRMNDMMLELISLKNNLCPGPLMPAEKSQFFTTLYDLDTFREAILEKDGATSGISDARTLERATTDDTALLKLAMQWLRHYLIRNYRKNR